MDLWGVARRVVAVAVCLGLAGVMSACGTERSPQSEDETETLAPSQFFFAVDKAVAEVGGLSWTADETPDPDQSSTQSPYRAAGVMVASDPVQSHEIVTGSHGGELIVGAGLICHQGLFTASELPLIWPEWPKDRPWNCLPSTDKLWSVVGYEGTGVSRDPLSVLARLDVNEDWHAPVASGAGEQTRIRYEFDGFQVWLDSDHLPRSIASTDESARVWTISPAADATVTLPPKSERTSLSPGFGRGQVGSCCLPMGEPPTPW